MTGLVWAVLGIFCCLAMTALGDMVSEEARDRLDHLPHAILRLAARRLDPAHRLTVYQDEWLPELAYILKGDEARPITRLINGSWYARGILAKTDRIAVHLHRPVVEQGSQQAQAREAPKREDLARENLDRQLREVWEQRAPEAPQEASGMGRAYSNGF